MVRKRMIIAAEQGILDPSKLEELALVGFL
jgi:hypothetical protein